MVKIGILTARRSHINEEVICTFNGQSIKIGIIEFDDAVWFPFRFEPQEDENYHGFTDGDEDDMDGISDTWEDDHNNEKEEGEIAPNDDIRLEKEVDIPPKNNEPRSPKRKTKSLGKQLNSHDQASNGVRNITPNYNEIIENTETEDGANNNVDADDPIQNDGDLNPK
ncbi:hypothetical protein L1887_22290 [Cichorium endivia]|nr:hypothetical protein L1887_22290 [Cichorium endivia]